MKPFISQSDFEELQITRIQVARQQHIEYWAYRRQTAPNFLAYVVAVLGSL